mgnify:CR=1 FL=1
MLNKNQVKYLKSLANTCENKYQIGKYEVTDSLIEMLSNALDKYELIKVCLNKNVAIDKSDIAEELSQKLYAEVIQIIGGVIVLYRKNLKEPKIKLPR